MRLTTNLMHFILAVLALISIVTITILHDGASAVGLMPFLYTIVGYGVKGSSASTASPLITLGGVKNEKA